MSFGGRVTLAAVGAFVYLLIVVAYVAGNEPYFSLLLGSSFFLAPFQSEVQHQWRC